jgi:hypothetical protein
MLAGLLSEAIGARKIGPIGVRRAFGEVVAAAAAA